MLFIFYCNSYRINFRLTALMNTNNTSNYQSTNETHYTQENTTITTHKYNNYRFRQKNLTIFNVQGSAKKPDHFYYTGSGRKP